MENCGICNASVATGLERKKGKCCLENLVKESGRCLMQNSRFAVEGFP